MSVIADVERCRLLHISDPHFGTERPYVVESLFERVHTLKPDVVVISGDVTQRARRREFTAAREFIAALAPVPVVVVPGNHDIPLYNVTARVLWPYRGFQRVLRRHLDPRWSRGSVDIRGLTSAPRWRHKNGQLLPSALISLFPEPATSTRNLRIAVLHHPLDCRLSIDNHNIMKNAASVAASFARENVDLVLGGHIHDPFTRVSRHRYPQVARSMVLSLAGTCISRRVRRSISNSFNQFDITIDEAQARIDLQRWDANPDGQFEPALIQHFVRTAGDDWQERTPVPV